MSFLIFSEALKYPVVFNKMKVIDIGCGAGILSESLGRIGMGEVTGDNIKGFAGYVCS